jgi:hypothetical protein
MNGMAVGDVVTWGIIFIIGLAFLRFALIERNSLANLRVKINAIKQLKSKHMTGIIDSTNLTVHELSWLSEHILFERVEQTLHIDRTNGLWLSRSAVSMMLPDFDSSKNKLAPAILTSLGIVGTFLGITIGLSHFNMSGESKVLLTSAAELLSGMKTAFYTSLAGLGLSSTFMIMSKIIAAKANSLRSDLYRQLANEYYEVSAIHYLKNLNSENQQESIKAQKESAQAILTLGRNISAITEQFGTIADSFNSEIIASRISDSIQTTMDNSLTPVLMGIQTELASIRDLKQVSQERLIQSIMNSVKEDMIAPLTQTLSQTARQLRESNQVSTQLNDNIAQVVASTSQTLNSIDDFQRGTMLKLEVFAQSLTGILEQFKGDTQGAMSEIAKQVENTLNSANLGLEQQRQAFEGSANSATKAFDGIRSAMDQALIERQKAEKVLFEDVQSQIKSVLNELIGSFDLQTQLLEKTGKEASTLMDVARTELERGLGDIDGKVKSMVSTVQSELDTFRITYQEKLTDYFSQQNTLLEFSLGKQRDGLNGVVENFRKVFEEEYKTRHNLFQELTAQYQKLEASAATIERVAKAIGLNEAAKMAELQDAAQALSKEVGQLKREYANASATFNDIVENLPKAMDEYFSRANQSFETFFKDFDHSASTIHNKLAQAASFLVTAQAQKRAFEQDRAEA